VSEIFVLDASAILALLKREPGFDQVAEALPNSRICSVNLAEVSTKLVEYNITVEEVNLSLRDFALYCDAFSTEQAVVAGLLRKQTRAKGLSLGDRACLALALELGATVLTSDRAWADLDVGVTIELIR
jgi:ribonuclease VapC